MSKIKQSDGDLRNWFSKPFLDEPEFIRFKDKLPESLKKYASSYYNEQRLKERLERQPASIEYEKQRNAPSGAPGQENSFDTAANVDMEEINARANYTYRNNLSWVVVGILCLMLGVGLAADSLKFITYTNGAVLFSGIAPAEAAISAGLIGLAWYLLRKPN